MDELLLPNQQHFERVCDKMKKLLIKKQQIKHEEPKEIINGLLIGNYSYALNKKYLSDHRVTLVVSCLKIQERDRSNEVEYKEVLVRDQADENIKQYFDEVVGLIHNHLNEGEGERRCLVNCFSGKSRSSTFAIAFLIKNNKMSFQEAFDLAKSKCPRIQPNSGFITQLKEYADSIQALQKQKQIEKNEAERQNNTIEPQNVQVEEVEKQENNQNVQVEIEIEKEPIIEPQNQQEAIKQISPQAVEDQKIKTQQIDQGQTPEKEQVVEEVIEGIVGEIVEKNTEQQKENMPVIQKESESEVKIVEEEGEQEGKYEEAKDIRQEAQEDFHIMEKHQQKQQIQEQQAQVLEQQITHQKQLPISPPIAQQGLIEVQEQNSPEVKPQNSQTISQKQLLELNIEKIEESEIPESSQTKKQQQPSLEAGDMPKQQQPSTAQNEQTQAANETTYITNEQGQIRKKKKKHKKKK